MGIINIGAVFAGIMIYLAVNIMVFMELPRGNQQLVFIGRSFMQGDCFVVALGGIFRILKGSKITRMLAYVFAAEWECYFQNHWGIMYLVATDCLAASAVYLIIPSKLLKQNIHSNELQTQGDYKE